MPTPYTPPGSSTSYDVPADLDAVDVGVWFEDFADTVDAALALKLANAPAKNTQTADFDFALTDAAGLLVVANKATALAGTLKQNSAMASSWPTDSVIRFINRNDGVLTITAGSGVTIIGTPLTFAKGKGGALVWVAANTWVCVPFSSGSAAPTVSGTTGSPTTSSITLDGVSGTLYDFGSNGSITTTAGRARVLIIGGGSDDSGPNYGNAGIVFAGWIDFTAATHTVTVGARGTGASAGGFSAIGSLAGANGGLKPTNPANGIGAGRWLNVADYAGVPDGITGSTVTYAGAAGSSLTTYGSSYAGPASVAGRVFIFIPS